MVCGPSQLGPWTTKLFIPCSSHYTRATTNYPPPSTRSHQLSGAIKPIWSTDFGMSSRALLLMIGVVVWPIFQIQRLVTASAGPRATILHLYLEDIFYHSHLYTRSPCESRYLLSLTRHHLQMDISSVQKSRENQTIVRILPCQCHSLTAVACQN